MLDHLSQNKINALKMMTDALALLDYEDERASALHLSAAIDRLTDAPATYDQYLTLTGRDRQGSTSQWS